ncbi:MAG: hypothetical protein C5B50_08130 [Verrucomicrobia bacterium]|nr:MAG: hypothetical protein C5B50_08130 [Verrucomicrobiota bacterium]
MSQRFEIPIEPKGYNLFLIDDYLRTLRSKEERKKLIREVGYSAEKREEYERSHSLPRGAIELALLAEDKKAAELNDMLTKRMKKLYDDKAPQEEVQALFKEAGSRAAGIKALYPEAFQFIMQYYMLAKRNASMFRGDYRFSNEFKIMRVDCSPSSNTDTCGDDPVNTCINVNLVVFVNVYGYVFAAAWVGLVAFLAVVLYVWAAVFVIP